MDSKIHTLEVWGDLACFTRPEMKVERYSYPIMTPSAARAVFDAIYWKPKLRWQVARIETLSEPHYIALRRNEVKDKVPPADTILKWAQGKKKPEPLWADGDRDSLGTDQRGRTQRQTMALKKVRYRISAYIVPWSEYRGEIRGMDAQFLRHASHGQCIYQPYLGCREFPAYFRPVESGESLAVPFPLDQNLGWMIYDVFDLSRPGTKYDLPRISLFRAVVRKGVLDVPDYENHDVRKPPREVQPCSTI
ncbi:CRISPR-associated protein Cas5 [Candidatus Methylomirabilis lanthanidiphila]|uniref:pre-crRNA processing endonuclease n=1 Tax=Candidatus Methylomirabilis lanthanidiphila TaxID=2211376 RepID=A0A564ZLE0_9BACT|nr:type I-C CRISPR-associated protein Cas5c [Candidatus Methylomirabilis lanthanidiphila]VUZ86149.1 CRISPR-associated protein Cas5 [Candidatus Methylomirabilis lanthanidiphila]